MRRKASEKIPDYQNDKGKSNSLEKAELIPEHDTSETIISKLNNIIRDKDCEIKHLRSLLSNMEEDMEKLRRSKGNWDGQAKTTTARVDDKTGGNTLNIFTDSTLGDEQLVPYDSLPATELEGKKHCRFNRANGSPGEDTIGQSCSKEMGSAIRKVRDIDEPLGVGLMAETAADRIDGAVRRIRKVVDRSKSVIVFGLGEKDEKNYQKRVSTERDSLRTLLQGLGFDQGEGLIAKQMRIGKYKGYEENIRPLKLILESPMVQQELLRRAATFRFKEDHHGVFIRRDMTIEERIRARRTGRKETTKELRTIRGKGSFFRMTMKPKATCRLDPWMGPAG